MERLTELWYRPPGPIYALAPIALAYGAAVRLRRSLYRRRILKSTRLGVPVIVVGNITVGGTGKTPLTLWLAERLARSGMAPGVVCKSYAASAASPHQVRPGDDPGASGDESVMLATRLSCPVWSGPDRVATARAMLAADAGINVIICDDGLQHYALERDCEIAVVDAERGFGNGLLLPAGPLREPRCRLRSVDAIVLNGTGDVAGLPSRVPMLRMSLVGTALRNLVDPARTALPAEFAGRHIVAIAGIGHPQRFFAHLRGLGLDVQTHRFPDHFAYRADDLRMESADAVLMTEKDAIKCARFRDARMWVLPVSAELSDDLLRLVLECLDRKRNSSPPPARIA